MKKIPFEDLPSTDTPIDSDNLNLMQDNMEDAIIPIKLVDISDSAPSSATTGDMYYNTTDNKVYTATATNTWDSGSTPRYDGFYVNTNDNTLFYYNGSTLIGVGGSQSGVNIKNEYTTSDTDAYSCNYINNLENQISYSLTEQKTNEIWINGKPIYRKVFNGIKSGSLQFNISNLNIDEVTNAYGNLHVQQGSDNQYRHIPSYGSSANYVSYEVQLNNGILSIGGATAGYSQGEVTFILEYTKTTDTVS